MIDDQVHFREPGLEDKGDIGSESRAAVAGGITSYMEMPNPRPPTVTVEALEAKYAVAARKSAANYAFYLGATNDNISQIRALAPGTACGATSVTMSKDSTMWSTLMWPALSESWMRRYTSVPCKSWTSQ